MCTNEPIPFKLSTCPLKLGVSCWTGRHSHRGGRCDSAHTLCPAPECWCRATVGSPTVFTRRSSGLKSNPMAVCLECSSLKKGGGARGCQGPGQWPPSSLCLATFGMRRREHHKLVRAGEEGALPAGGLAEQCREHGWFASRVPSPPFLSAEGSQEHAVPPPLRGGRQPT